MPDDQAEVRTDAESVNQGFQAFTAVKDLTDPTGGEAAGGVAEQHQIQSSETDPPRTGGPLAALLSASPPLPEYITGLFNHSRVLLAPLLLGRGTWMSPVFPFVRYAKAHPAITDLPADQAWRAVRTVVLGWRKKEPDYWWEAHFCVTEEDAEVEFLHWWDNLRSLPNADPLEYALQLADATPLRLLKEVVAKRSKKYPRFVSFAFHLQRNIGPRTPIFLPIVRIGLLLGVEPMTISRYRKWADQDGYLRKVKPAAYRPKGGGEAATYLFDLTMFPQMAKE